MRMLNTRQGFTLIELLVVIGILAVLAAIAIPSVAGLIDRANKSSDATNTNEMTNAIERFASEYELYCQDIASGVIKDADNDGKPDNMDSVQSRVYNTILVGNRNGIENIEYKNGDIIPENQIALYIDTKYPANVYTIQKLIGNYMKTSSSTLEPKQSDCHYFYSPDCGMVVCAEVQNATTEQLNALVYSQKDAKGNNLSAGTIWIDLTVGTLNTLPEEHGEIIPAGGVYYIQVTSNTIGNYSGYKEKRVAGQHFPQTVQTGDVYVYGDYEYRYGISIHDYDNTYENNGWTKHWTAVTYDKTKQQYGELLNMINGLPLTDLGCTYMDCKQMTTAPQIPETVKIMVGTYENCEKLEIGPSIPDSVTIAPSVFYKCKSLKTVGHISDNIYYTEIMFAWCESLEVAPKLPSKLKDASYMFIGCSKMKTYEGSENNFDGYVIPSTVTEMESMFDACYDMTGTIVVNANPTKYDKAFRKVSGLLYITGESQMLDVLAKTDGFNDLSTKDVVRVK